MRASFGIFVSLSYSTRFGAPGRRRSRRGTPLPPLPASPLLRPSPPVRIPRRGALIRPKLFIKTGLVGGGGVQKRGESLRKGGVPSLTFRGYFWLKFAIRRYNPGLCFALASRCFALAPQWLSLLPSSCLLPDWTRRLRWAERKHGIRGQQAMS